MKTKTRLPEADTVSPLDMTAKVWPLHLKGAVADPYDDTDDDGDNEDSVNVNKAQ